MGRPLWGAQRLEVIQTRLEPDTIKALDRWSTAQGFSRSEAIRRLVELGLNAAPDRKGKW
jgi:hypothetical protein